MLGAAARQVLGTFDPVLKPPHILIEWARERAVRSSNAYDLAQIFDQEVDMLVHISNSSRNLNSDKFPSAFGVRVQTAQGRVLTPSKEHWNEPIGTIFAR